MFMELQKSVLLFFSENHTNMLNAAVKVVTVFGESFIPLALAFFIFWNIDKKKGFVTLGVFAFAFNVMELLKAAFKIPRPWQVIPELDPQRVSTATGYSFPSGHSTIASSFYGTTAIEFKKKSIRIVCVILIVLVPVSRLYLCVHWPMDVVVGVAIGLGSAFLLHKILAKLFDNIAKWNKSVTALGIAVFIAGIILSVYTQKGLLDYLIFNDFIVGFALVSGLLIAMPIEEKYCSFSTEAPWKAKIIRYIIGMAVEGMILFASDLLLPSVTLVRFLRYFAGTLWPVFYPFLVKKLAKHKKFYSLIQFA